MAKRVQRQKLKKQQLKTWQKQQAQRQSHTPSQAPQPVAAQAMAKNLALLSEKKPAPAVPPAQPSVWQQLKQYLAPTAYLKQATVPTAAELNALADVVGQSLPPSYQRLMDTVGPFYGGGYFFAGASAIPAADLLYLNQALRADLLPEANSLCVFAVSETHFLAYDFDQMTTALEPAIVRGDGRGYQRVARQLSILIQQINAQLKS